MGPRLKAKEAIEVDGGIPPAGGGGMHRTQFQKQKKTGAKPGDFFPFLFR
jgi:hypothetical protein